MKFNFRTKIFSAYELNSCIGYCTVVHEVLGLNPSGRCACFLALHPLLCVLKSGSLQSSHTSYFPSLLSCAAGGESS